MQAYIAANKAQTQFIASIARYDRYDYVITPELRHAHMFDLSLHALGAINSLGEIAKDFLVHNVSLTHLKVRKESPAKKK